jgi:ABC-type transport system involved in cytochrome c biogenesis ATPase subunit
VRLRNFRSFVDSGIIELGRITVLVGPNNSGKTSILKAIHSIQASAGDVMGDVRVNEPFSEVNLVLRDATEIGGWGIKNPINDPILLNVQITSPDRRSGGLQIMALIGDQGGASRPPLPNSEPHHLLVPYLSKRKASGYQEDVRAEYALRVTGDGSFLAAKLARLSNPSFPGHREYVEACTAILGIAITAVPSANGLRPGVYLPDKQTIFIDQMGEGVPNIAMLLADLSLSEDKVFLVEEPENDLHPTALKALLQLIRASAGRNQFIVSTHSHIVVRELASMEGSRLYRIASDPKIHPPVAGITHVPPTPGERLAALAELGYSLSDFELWEGWLILEESSAEVIIRDYLIPSFAPRLTRIRTLAAGGTSRVEPSFDDFARLVLFSHLEVAYRQRAWVRVDDDDIGRSLVKRLRAKYDSWPEDRFQTFGAASFETYYPKVFEQEIIQTLSIKDKDTRREAKKKLLENVKNWLDEDPDRARDALAESAKDVISHLREIERQAITRQ